jgi:hypothetical protein
MQIHIEYFTNIHIQNRYQINININKDIFWILNKILQNNCKLFFDRIINYKEYILVNV